MSRQASYGISKATVNALTVKLAAEMEANGILVNAVCPGEHAWLDAVTVRGEGLKGLLATVVARAGWPGCRAVLRGTAGTLC